MERKLGKYLVLGRFLRTTTWIQEFLAENKIDIIYRANNENVEKIVNKVRSEKRDCNKVILIDLDDWPSFSRNKYISIIMCNGKNYGVDVILTTTYPVEFPPHYVEQLEKIINLHDGPVPRSVSKETLAFYGLG
jgi:hypothetical protein